jgi:tripartite-type tricarboxylate transporter receptor subunit TctC
MVEADPAGQHQGGRVSLRASARAPPMRAHHRDLGLAPPPSPASAAHDSRLLAPHRARCALLALVPAIALSGWVDARAASVQPAPWPQRPLRFIVPFAPGGPLDVTARLIAQPLGAELQQPVLVDNRPGAGGSTGAALAARAAPDGHTLLMGALSTHAVNPFLYPDVGYDAERDFAPVTLVARVPNVLVVHPGLKVESVAQLVALARAKPGQLAYGSGGGGSGGHLAGALLAQRARVELVHVPYKGAAPAMADLVAGRVPFMFDNLASALPQVKAGRVAALAVTSPARSRFLPEVPTMAEAGQPGFDITTWFGVFVPAGVPAPRVARLHSLIAGILLQPGVRERMAGFGSDTEPLGPQAFAAFVRAERERYRTLVRDTGAKAD